MLLKRQEYAKQTFSAVLKQQTPAFRADNALLKGLQKMYADLTARTQNQVSQSPTSKFNTATQRIIDLTDEWIAFEARCISSNNEMSAGKSDSAVRKKLARRANGLSETLDSIKAAGATDNLSTLEQTVSNLVAEAANDGSSIADPAAFGKRIDDCTKQLRAVANSISDALEGDLEPFTGMTQDSHDKWVDLQETQLKQLYGIDAKTTPIFGLQPGTFPYRDLLDVLAMVPSDHSLNQWRAPGEWFAELYAITWFKKVEPPAGVASAVRPYLYGGHITPDQAV
jgi:hypothetical protein